MISKGTKYKILLASGTIILLTVIWDLKTVKYKQLEVSETVTNIKYALNRYKLFKTIKYEDQLNVFLSNIRSEGKYMFVEPCHTSESYLYVVENTNIETIINQNVEKLSNVAAKLRFFKLLSLPLQSICRYEL